MSQLATQLDYQREIFAHPTYNMHKILPQSGNQSYTLTPAGGNDTIFEIPVSAFNLSRSVLEFGLTPAANAAAFYYAYKDALGPIRQMQLYTRSGIYICDLYELANYTKVVWKPDTKLQNFLTYDTFSEAGGFGRGIRPINAIAAANQRYQDNTPVSVSYLEPQYIEPGTGANATPSFDYIIPLSMINNTIFSLDKDIFLGEIVLLRIVWHSVTKMYYNGTDAGVPTTGVTAMTANVTASNLTLYLAVEKNLEIVNQLKSQVVSGGLNILIPYVYTYKTNLGPSSSQTVSLRFNRGHGRRLMKIYHSVFNNNESVSTGRDNAAGNATTIASAYDNDNRFAIVGGFNAVLNRSKVQQFYTMLDNERLQEINLVCANGDDYMYLKDKIKDSVILNSDVYYYNWFWLEDFSGLSDKTISPKNEQNLETGLDLSVERKWDFYALQVNNYTANAANVLAATQVANTNGGQYNHYTFAVTQKMLTVSSAGITCI